MLINYAEAARAARDVAMAAGDLRLANAYYALSDVLKDLSEAHEQIAKLTAERDAALALVAELKAKGA